MSGSSNRLVLYVLSISRTSWWLCKYSIDSGHAINKPFKRRVWGSLRIECLILLFWRCWIRASVDDLPCWILRLKAAFWLYKSRGWIRVVGSACRRKVRVCRGSIPALKKDSAVVLVWIERCRCEGCAVGLWLGRWLCILYWASGRYLSSHSPRGVWRATTVKRQPVPRVWVSRTRIWSSLGSGIGGQRSHA
jgi:hypothetical protein